jgi:hypothetical protein
LGGFRGLIGFFNAIKENPAFLKIRPNLGSDKNPPRARVVVSPRQQTNALIKNI